jgi:hypothetical protein
MWRSAPKLLKTENDMVLESSPVVTGGKHPHEVREKSITVFSHFMVTTAGLNVFDHTFPFFHLVSPFMK